MEIPVEVAERLIRLWLNWQESRPTHQRLFFNFFEEVVRQDASLREITLLDTLAVLNATTGISPDSNR
jgi:hypothetical protein